MSRVDDTLNKINFRSDYPHNGVVESLLKTLAINRRNNKQSNKQIYDIYCG